MKSIVLAFSLLISSTSFACTCSQYWGDVPNRPGVEKLFSASDVIVVGTAISYTAGNIDDSASSFATSDFDTVIFEVQEQWKGDLQATITVRAFPNITSCNETFKVGTTYLLYLSYSKEDLVGGLTTCGATREDTLRRGTAWDKAVLDGLAPNNQISNAQG
ncbi:MAG: hypothetical protein GKR91_15260 [Pseudomonadales bacterium]|nr:hypothetical protein [Pseudomonadales bacterium]